ncbi:MAG TPA: TonB family protein [Bryobacteraceae bacterium]|jgi:TonB family protein|nr:TonB family protein [Bryobacteraceae bacterium]
MHKRDSGVTPPSVIYRVEPEYSDEARQAGIEGTVVLSALIDEKGKATNLKVTQPLGHGLDQMAMEAVDRWVFRPGMKDSKPAAVQTSIEVGFHLRSSLSWHLSDISYKPLEDASDPVLTSEKYPPNAAPGSTASITLSFDVDEHGVPVRLQVEKSSDRKWEADVLAAVGEWRFAPGMRNFEAVVVPCTVSLTLGESRSALGGPLRIGNGVLPPQVISKVAPKYTKEASKAKLEGTVIVLVVVDEQGHPRDVRVIRPLGLGLEEMAIEAVRQWLFRPGTKDGKPVAVQATIQVNFLLR